MDGNEELFRKLSVVIRNYNDHSTLENIIFKVRKVEKRLEMVIVLVNDASTDGTTDLIRKQIDEEGIVKHQHTFN